MNAINAPAFVLACLLSSTIAHAQCEYTIHRGFAPTVFIAQQGRPTAEPMDMYGAVRTDAFLIGGHTYYAGTDDGTGEIYTLDSFLSATRPMLTDRMNGLIANMYPDEFLTAYDSEWDEWYNYVPGSVFAGLAIMDIEGHELAAHPDLLLDHYESTTWNGLSGNQIADRIMQQYGLCADITSRGFPEGRIGMFNVVRTRRNGTASDLYVRKVNFFKQKAADSRNWLRNVDYICPVLWSAWVPSDEVNSCQASGNTIASCSARYLGAAQATIGAFTRGPLVDFDSCGGDETDPFSGCSNFDPEEWIWSDPVRDGEGNIIKICPILSIRVFNDASCAGGEYLIEPFADPTLTQTLGVTTAYLNDLVFNRPACIVDSYAYWVPADVPFQPVRQTLSTLPWPRLGDYNGNGFVGAGDNNRFTFHFENRDERADLNGDYVVDRHDRAIMDALLETP